MDTSVKPYKSYQFNGIEWVRFNDIPIGSMVVEGGVITSVSTLPYNQTQKVETISWGMPDYTAGIDISSGFIAPCDGVVWAVTSDSNNGTVDGEVYIDGVRVAVAACTSYTITIGQYVLVPKNSVVTTKGTIYGLTYFPMKGAK